MAEHKLSEFSAALESVGSEYAAAVTDEFSDVETHPAPFLKHYKIYKVLSYNPDLPTLFFAGFAPGRDAYLLTGSPENYVKMAKDDGVNIDSAKEAAQYVTVALEVTRSMSKLVYVVNSVEDVKFQGNLDEDEEATKKEFIKKYRSRIKAPDAEPAGNGYHVTAFVVSNQTISRHSVIVSEEGDMKSEVTVLDDNLPLMMGA